MMKTFHRALAIPMVMALLSPTASAEGDKDKPKPATPPIELPEIDYPEPTTEAQKKASDKHREGAQNLAGEQDELSADVQDLIEEQTDEKVIALLEEVEEIMAEVTGSLDETNTGGKTIAAETEIIEKIFEAAKQRAQKNGGT